MRMNKFLFQAKNKIGFILLFCGLMVSVAGLITIEIRTQNAIRYAENRRFQTMSAGLYESVVDLSAILDVANDEKSLLLASSSVLADTSVVRTYLILMQIESTPLNRFLSSLEEKATDILNDTLSEGSSKEDAFSSFHKDIDTIQRFVALLSRFLSSPYEKEKLEREISNLFYLPVDLSESDSLLISPSVSIQNEEKLAEKAAKILESYLRPESFSLAAGGDLVCYGSDSSFVVLSKEDGELIQLSRSYTPSSAVLAEKEAIRLCERFLKQYGPKGAASLTASNESDGFLHAVFTDGQRRIHLSLSLDIGRICHYHTDSMDSP